MDHYIYNKVNVSKIIFLVLYMDDTLLASSEDHEMKRFLSQQFDIKDMGEASMLLA